MTKEDKSLLLKDLCARLPYGVKMIDTEPYSAEHNPILTLSYISEDNCIGCRAGKGFMATSLGSIKPYLLPLSSMTDKQAKEIQEIIGNPNYACIMRKTGGLELWLESIDTDPTIWLDTIFEVQDYLNKNHFDYRELIEKGLAIDATGLNIY